MNQPRIWDISQRIHARIPSWPGEPAVSIERHAAISPDCPVNVGAISMPLHTGTHADAPLHYSDDGLASAECDLSPYIGKCAVIDVSKAGPRVEIDDCDWDMLEGHRRVLMRTYQSFPHERWNSDFKAIAPAVIERLAAMDVALIGVDTPSLDPETSKTMDAHHQVLAADMRILEGLVLEGIECGTFELIALPLKLAGADASPVRAILRDIGR